MKHVETKDKQGFQVIEGSKRSQAAIMVLEVGESTGGPTNKHQTSDQWLYVVSGRGRAIVGYQQVKLGPGSLLLIEAGEPHQIDNTGDTPLETVNVYAPPEY
jgi:mannose-6-phosphate isomerase-like protein (cupin superfamily)